jgi:hypothetical protein
VTISRIETSHLHFVVVDVMQCFEQPNEAAPQIQELLLVARGSRLGEELAEVDTVDEFKQQASKVCAVNLVVGESAVVLDDVIAVTIPKCLVCAFLAIIHGLVCEIGAIDLSDSNDLRR